MSEADAAGPPVTLLEPFDCDLVALGDIEFDVLLVELLPEDMPLDGADAAGVLVPMDPEFELPIEPDDDGEEFMLLSDLWWLFFVVVVSVVEAELLDGAGAAGVLVLMLPEFELPIEPDDDGEEFMLLSDLWWLFFVVVVSVVEAPPLVVDCVVEV